MLKKITLIFTRPFNIDVGLYHLLEHCLVKKIEKNLILNKLNYGVVIDAETFLDGFFIDIVYSTDFSVTNFFETIKESLIFKEFDDELIEAEIKIIKQEIDIVDITNEEISVYSPLKQYISLDIFELFKLDVNINITKIKKIFNSSVCSIYHSTNQTLTCLEKNMFPTLTDNFIPKITRTSDFLVGSLIVKNCTIEDFVVTSFLSFILGKTANSLIDEYCLKDNDLYLGYTHDIFMYNSYIVIFLCEYQEHVDMSWVFNSNTYDKISKTMFLENLYAFKTFFLLNMEMKNLSKFLVKMNSIETEVKYEHILQIIDDLTLEKVKKILEKNCII